MNFKRSQTISSLSSCSTTGTELIFRAILQFEENQGKAENRIEIDTLLSKTALATRTPILGVAIIANTGFPLEMTNFLEPTKNKQMIVNGQK